MFRPNRIGTPYILDNSLDDDDTSSYTVAEDAVSTAAFHANIINAAPLQDFGRTSLYWTGAARTLTASKRMAIAGQFTITPPLAGDVVGVELMGAIQFPCTGNISVQPFIAKAQSTAGAVLASVALYQPQLLPVDPIASQGQNLRNMSYRNQVIIRQPTLTLDGTYVHGFLITEAQTTPANITWTWFFAQYGIRQLNDQQDVGYRDTLR